MGTGLKRIFPAMAVASLVTALMAVTMGGVVRVTGSGLGCPDWPLCYGKVIPPWELTSWLEYMHRLSAAVAGFFTFLMVISAFSRYGARGATIHLVLLSAVLIVIQAGFGAYTVLSELSPGVALIHTAIATSLVGVLAVIVARTAVPMTPQSAEVALDNRWDRFRRLILALAAVAFIVVLTGAYVTRTEGASLACTSIPLCGISIGDMATIHWIHMTHRIAAFLVAVLMLVAIIRGDGRPSFRCCPVYMADGRSAGRADSPWPRQRAASTANGDTRAASGCSHSLLCRCHVARRQAVERRL